MILRFEFLLRFALRQININTRVVETYLLCAKISTREKTFHQ